MSVNPSTKVRINPNIKKEANEIFNALGFDLSSAISIFLHQCILRGGLPFKVELPNYKKETIDAMIEAKKISSDPNVKSYSSMDDLMQEL